MFSYWYKDQLQLWKSDSGEFTDQWLLCFSIYILSWSVFLLILEQPRIIFEEGFHEGLSGSVCPMSMSVWHSLAFSWCGKSQNPVCSIFPSSGDPEQYKTKSAKSQQAIKNVQGFLFALDCGYDVNIFLSFDSSVKFYDLALEVK